MALLASEIAIFHFRNDFTTSSDDSTELDKPIDIFRNQLPDLTSLS